MREAIETETCWRLNEFIADGHWECLNGTKEDLEKEMLKFAEICMWVGMEVDWFGCEITM